MYSGFQYSYSVVSMRFREKGASVYLKVLLQETWQKVVLLIDFVKGSIMCVFPSGHNL